MGREIMHIELDGFEIARVLSGPDRDALAEALVGCTFYVADSTDDDGFIIEAVDPTAARVTVRTSSGKPHDIQLVRGTVESTPDVQKPIDRERARVEAPDPKDITILRTAGVDKDISRGDAQALAATLLQRDLPDQQARFAFWSTAKRNGLLDLLSVAVRKWATLVRGQMPADLAIQFVNVQRAARQPEHALCTVEQGLADPFVLPSQRGILLTQRLALLLDLYDQTGDRMLLAQADEAYASALSVDPQSAHLQRAKARLDRLSRA